MPPLFIIFLLDIPASDNPIAIACLGFVTFLPEDDFMDNSIEYHRSNGLCTFNWACDQSKQDSLTMEQKLHSIAVEVEAM